MLSEDGVLECTPRVPDMVADITLRADLRSQKLSAALQIDAPGGCGPCALRRFARAARRRAAR